MCFKKVLLLSALGIFVLIQFTGCTLIGISAGKRADMRIREPLVPADPKVQEIKPGTKLDIGLKDNTQAQGKLNAFSQLPESRYAETLKDFSFAHSEAAAFPALNDTVKVSTPSKKDADCCFLGFEGKNWVFRMVETEKIAKIQTGDMTAITDTDGNPLSLTALNRLAEMDKLPNRQSIVLLADSGSLTIPMDDITFIKRSKKSRKALTYGLLGLAADLAAIYVSSVVFFSKMVDEIWNN
jgi:hypothetical protein